MEGTIELRPDLMRPKWHEHGHSKCITHISYKHIHTPYTLQDGRLFEKCSPLYSRVKCRVNCAACYRVFGNYEVGRCECHTYSTYSPPQKKIIYTEFRPTHFLMLYLHHFSIAFAEQCKFILVFVVVIVLFLFFFTGKYKQTSGNK